MADTDELETCITEISRAILGTSVLAEERANLVLLEHQCKVHGDTVACDKIKSQKRKVELFENSRDENLANLEQVCGLGKTKKQ